MLRDIVGIVIGPILFAVYFFFRREYYGALGFLISAVIMAPILLWLDGYQLPPKTYYIGGGVAVLLTVLELLYLRSKKRKSTKK